MLDCVVAEDEVLLRESLLAMLAAHADVLRVVAACEDGGAALEAIAEYKPAIAFLDIRMPGLTGLEVAAAGNADPAAFQALLRQLTTVLPTPPSSEPPLGWITASTGKETRLIMVEDVAYFRAEHKYTTVVTAEGEALLRKPIRELLAVLDPALFRQVHRSTIVNLKAIASVVRDDDGRGHLKLRNRPETLIVSQPFMALFRSM